MADINLNTNDASVETGTGNPSLGNYTFDVDQTVGAGQDNYVLTYDNASGLIQLEAAAAGGLSNVVEDTTPQLGGNLDVNGNSIVSTTNGDIAITPNGTGVTNVTNLQLASNNITDSNGNEIIELSPTVSAANHLMVQNSTTGNPISILSAGTDAEVGIDFRPKGGNTSRVYFDCNIGIHATSSIIDSGGYKQLEFNGVGAGTNHVLCQNAGTGFDPGFEAAGSDTNVNLYLEAKGNGSVKLGPGGSDVDLGSFNSEVQVNGLYLVGSDASPQYMGGTFTPRYQIHGTTSPTSGKGFYRWTADHKGPIFDMAKSRGATVGTHTALNDNDGIMLIRGWGSDGTQFKEGARIKMAVDGTVSTGVVPGEIQFATANSSGTRTDAVYIRADQSTEFYGQVVKTNTNPSSSSGAITFDAANGNYFNTTLTENITSITLSNPAASGLVTEIYIEFLQDATGSRTVSGWPAAVKWAGGSAPTITTTASTGRDVIRLTTRDGGTTWLGTYEQNFS